MSIIKNRKWIWVLINLKGRLIRLEIIVKQPKDRKLRIAF